MTGRKTLFLITIVMVVVLGTLFYFSGAGLFWYLWSVPAKYSGFADLREVLSGIELVRTGSVNSVNSFGLVAGYPGIWGVLGWLGMGAGDTSWLAIVIFCGFGVSLFVFAHNYDSLTAVLIATLVFSPAAMLGYERANLDLLIFIILSIALWLDSISPILAVGMVVLAALLKIYPILGLAYALKQPRHKFLLWGGIALGILIIYGLVIGRGLGGIVSYIPKGDLFAYGAGVIGFHAYQMGASRLLTNWIILFSFLILYLLALGILYLSYKLRDRASLLETELPFMDAFRMGAAIYIGTFVQGNSFNYRLIFLVFCIPQLVACARSRIPSRLEARITLAALIASCWGAILLHLLPANLVFALDQLANWILFAGVSYLLFATLPDWLFGEIQRFFAKYERRSAAAAS